MEDQTLKNKNAIEMILENQKDLLTESGYLVISKMGSFSLNEMSSQMRILKKIGEAEASIKEAISILKDYTDGESN